jgi:hypothetical protein
MLPRGIAPDAEKPRIRTEPGTPASSCQPVLAKLAALVPLCHGSTWSARVDVSRSRVPCKAAITPTPRQQGNRLHSTETHTAPSS